MDTLHPFTSLWRTEGDAGGAGTEDCLNVNIYAPAGAKPSSNCKIHSIELVLFETDSQFK